ncbi:heavy-metal-associated domain-containing protein [Arthrobacter sp. PsM3]|uniref:heavy-metal-associated domain-containing protein n=1 Tax=Arthrobacter sp. PsM3 TaxID=3030531 RepID=UPI00263AAD5E|nr:cation transporter [Arthrobacter sp. PsM3]MDN4643931.1 cation transporter [Arthrobacter sp. PsM3]
MYGVEDAEPVGDQVTASSSAAAVAQPRPAKGNGPASGREYALEGLTCGHCVDAVEKAVSGLVGVESASVDLVPGGTS